MVDLTSPITLVMVDDNIDEIFLARRQMRVQGVLNRFISEHKSENLLSTLAQVTSEAGCFSILILLDVSMPRMDGFETLKALRNDDRFRDMLIIMFSASDDDADMTEAMKLGADGYLVKPFAIDSFVSVLKGLPQVKYQLVSGPSEKTQ